MMRLAALLLGSIFGPWLRVATVPLLLVAAVTMAKALWERRDARLVREGEMICRVDWERQTRAEERVAAEAKLGLMEAALAAERQAVGGLHDEIARITAEAEALRAQAAGADERCLSAGVLDALDRSARPAAGRPAGTGRAGARRR